METIGLKQAILTIGGRRIFFASIFRSPARTVHFDIQEPFQLRVEVDVSAGFSRWWLDRLACLQLTDLRPGKFGTVFVVLFQGELIDSICARRWGYCSRFA